MSQYTVLIEGGEGGSNYNAWVPDLPGCVSTGDTLEELQMNIAEAIEFHLRGMKEDGDAIPAPSRAVLVEVT